MQDTHRTLNETMLYAGFGRRFAAWAVDFLLVTVATIIASFFVGFIGDLLPRAAIMIFGAAVAVAYHCGFESSKYQATPGKMLFGLQVTDSEGQRISFLRALARHWGMHVSNITCGVGYLMILWTRKHQGLHDKIANCLVVRKPKILGCGHDHVMEQQI